MTCRVVVTKPARNQIRLVREWWQAHRTAAPFLFADELAHVLELLRTTPRIGVPYLAPGHDDLRRCHLPRSKYWLYYRYRERKNLVEVLAVHGAVRGSGPSLPPSPKAS